VEPFHAPSTLAHLTMPTIHPLVVAAMVGALSGTHAAIWGMYKDSIYEGFSPGRFVRSIIVGIAAGMLLQTALQLRLQNAASLLMLFGLAYASERGIVEIWKTFFRTQDQSKYFIPMTFSVGGVPVKSRGARIAAGIGYITLVALLLLALAQLDRDVTGPLTLGKSAIAGLVVGAMIAAGGAWKDAPKEGFQIVKFFRSPSVTVAFALALSPLTDSYLFLAAAAIGYERAAVETWKTFLAREKPPGKFAGKPELHPEMRQHRRQAVPAFVLIVALVILTAGLALPS
jgi:hypothetical protein